MEDPSKLYNPAGYDRWTPSDECQVQVLEEFAANCAFRCSVRIFSNFKGKICNIIIDTDCE